MLARYPIPYHLGIKGYNSDVGYDSYIALLCRQRCLAEDGQYYLGSEGKDWLKYKAVGRQSKSSISMIWDPVPRSHQINKITSDKIVSKLK